VEFAAVELGLYCLHAAIQLRPGHLRDDVDAGIVAHLRQLIRRETIGRGNKEIDGPKLGTGENSSDQRGIGVKYEPARIFKIDRKIDFPHVGHRVERVEMYDKPNRCKGHGA